MHDDDNYGGFGPLFDQAGDDAFRESQIPRTQSEQLIGELIWAHKGRLDPIALARLCELSKLNDRAVKDVVEKLVDVHKMQIGARRGKQHGYFIIQDEEDREVAVKPYKSQILTMLRRLRVLESPAKIREFLGQMQLEVDAQA